jgi:hypothetical protein
MISKLTTPVKNRFNTIRPFLPILFFLGGFLWDTFSLKRIDNVTDNALLMVYLLILGASIILSTLMDRDRLSWGWLYKFRPWIPLLTQFLLGGLFSAYVVFYFKSASLASSLIFVILLLSLFLANEFVGRKQNSLYLQLPLYFLVSFSFFIFFVPIVIKRVDYVSFWIGAGLSSLLLLGTMGILARFDGFKHRREMIVSGLLVICMFLTIHLFYSKNWIPPVPLSLKFSGMYYAVTQVEDSYHLSIEAPYWFQFWKNSNSTLWATGEDTLYCFTSIFAPTDLKDQIHHIWQQYEPDTGGWATKQTSKYDITGGRAQGYRGFSAYSGLAPGKWRVEIRSRDKLLLGRVGFKIRHGNRKRPLVPIFQ